MGVFASVVIASLLVSLISLVGGLLLVWKRLFSSEYQTYLVSFAAGVMLTAAFIDVLPEALESGAKNANIFLPTLLGIVTFFFLERFLLWFHHHDELHHQKPTPSLILLGDGLHNFIDGLVIAATFVTNAGLGLAATLAIAAHEVPQEIGDFSILVAGGMRRGRALFFNLLSALTAMVGAILGLYFFETLGGYLAPALAFTAGMFIYIACSDLIPVLHQDFREQKSWWQSGPFIVGILISFMTIRLLEG